MASIKDTADRQVTAGKWRSWDSEEPMTRNIYHYSTQMLSFKLDAEGQWDGHLGTVDYSTGHGSLSDQKGMNTLFARLGMPYYFQRQGGAGIVTLDGPQFRYSVTDKSKHGWRAHIIANYLEVSPC